MAQLLRVQSFNVSRDGFGAGENQSFERPFGDADPGDMFAWAGPRTRPTQDGVAPVIPSRIYWGIAAFSDLAVNSSW